MAFAAAAMQIAGGLAHFVIVDFSALMLNAPFVKWNPEPIQEQMKSARLQWELFGGNVVFDILSGFSIWVTISLIVLGLYNIAIFRFIAPPHRIRTFALAAGLATSFVFVIIAATCFIYPAVAGGLVALILFVLAGRRERQLNAAA